MEIRWYTFLTSSIYTMYGSVQRERNALEKKKKVFNSSPKWRQRKRGKE